MMTKSIAAIFATQDDGHAAVQDLLQNHIAADRIRMISGSQPEQADRAKEAGAGEASAAVASGGAVGLAGLSSLVLPGIGTLLAAGTAVAAINAAAASADDSDQDTLAPEQALQRVGFMKEQATSYAMDVQQGYTLIAVDAEDDQSDQIADIFHEHGGSKLDFRQREIPPT
jgi:hypothetical protein